MQFTDLELGTPLQQAVDALGYETTTSIQAQAIPAGLAGRDLVACAPTGTGKTLAFLLPALERLAREPANTRNPRLVVLEPTRELVIQVAGEALKLTNRMPLRVTAVYGGAQMKKQIDQLRRGTDVIVATPGRLMDHMRRGNVHWADLKILVLDEADRMLDMGFLPDIRDILSHMPRQRQTMLFSATISAEVASLARQFQHDPIQIEIDLARPPEAIQQALYPVPKHLKVQLLLAMLKKLSVESMLIFTRTKQEADIVTEQLGQSRISVACIHGDLNQRERIEALEGFRAGKYQVLVATNIAARGLDVEGISHVINYDVPEYPEDYVHRIGRTARAGADGDALTLVTPDDEVLIPRIEHLLGHPIARKTLAGFDYDVPTPSWAQPSAETVIKRAQQKQSVASRWRSMF